MIFYTVGMQHTYEMYVDWRCATVHRQYLELSNFPLVSDKSECKALYCDF